MILAITGSKLFNKKDRLFAFLDEKLNKIECINCGSCSKIDELIIEYCKTRGVICVIYNAKTHNLDGTFNKGATLKNRYNMIKESSHVLVLDCDSSEGAKLSIKMSQEMNKKLKIIKFKV